LPSEAGLRGDHSRASAETHPYYLLEPLTHYNGYAPSHIDLRFGPFFARIKSEPCRIVETTALSRS